MVSIVVPVKNCADKIKSLLDSLMKIDYIKKKFEVIVVDGNSTDDTREIVSQYPVILLTEERKGLNAARNTGLEHSKGEIIAFTDGDCVVPKNWLIKIVENFQDKNVGCVGGSASRYYDDFLSQYSDESIMPVLRRFKKKKILNKVKPPLQYPAGCNMAVRREVFNRVGVFDESIEFGFDEDELVERICRAEYKMVLDPEVSIAHKHRSSIMELLRQTFRYGRGIGIVLKNKGLESVFSKWVLLSISGLIAWTLIMVSLASLAILMPSFVSIALLAAFLLVPPAGLSLFYAYRIRFKSRKLSELVEYPLIDIARSAVFVVGSLYQILRSRKVKTEFIILALKLTTSDQKMALAGLFVRHFR